MPKYNININKNTLVDNLAIASEVSPSRSSLELLTSTKVSIEKNILTLFSMNDNRVTAISKIEIFEELGTDIFKKDGEIIEFLIKTHPFFSTVKMLKDEKISLIINTDNSTIVLKGSKAKHTLRISTKDLMYFNPENSQEETEISVNVKSSTLLEAIKGGLSAVGTVSTSYEPRLLDICFNLQPKKKILSVASTDKKRFIVTNIDAVVDHVDEEIFIIKEDKKYMVKGSNIKHLPSLLNNNLEENVFMEFTDNFLNLTVKGTTFIFKGTKSNYPEYTKFIPQEFSCSFEIIKKDAIEAFRQAYYFAKENVVNKKVELDIKPGQKSMTLISKNDKEETTEVVIDIENYEGTTEDWLLPVNAEYIMDYLNSCDNDRVLWEYNPGKPLVLSPKGEKNRQLYFASSLKVTKNSN